MINAFRAFRPLQPAPAALTSSTSTVSFGRKASAVRFTTSTLSNESQHPDNMDKTEKPTEKTGDVMSHSFGDGYATRSDEEGFGGIYGENQSLQKDQEIHENHPAYDKSQGSEVKEKEKARHQTQGSS